MRVAVLCRFVCETDATHVAFRQRTRSQVRVLAAFTSLRHDSNVSDALQFANLRFVRHLGAGA